jgi:hypothetical protein
MSEETARDRIERFAYHEGGHCAVGELYGLTVDRIELSARGGRTHVAGVARAPEGLALLYLAGMASESFVADAPEPAETDFTDAIAAARKVNPADPIGAVESLLGEVWAAVRGTRPRIEAVARALLAKADADPGAEVWALDGAELAALAGRSSGPDYALDLDPPADALVHLRDGGTMTLAEFTASQATRDPGPVTRTAEVPEARPAPQASALDSVALWRLEKVVADQTAAMAKIADAVAATVAKLGDAVDALRAAAERSPVVHVRLPRPAFTLHVPRTKKTVTQTALGYEIVSEPEA